MEFRKIKLSDRECFEKALKPSDIFWEFSFSCLIVWNKDRTYVLKTENYMLVYFELKDKYLFLPPYLYDEKYFGEAVSVAEKHAEDNGVKFIMRGLTEAQVAQLNGYNVTCKDSESDYIYSVKQLSELTGKKFHAKRNYVNRFVGKYNHSFREYTSDDYESAVNLCKKWLDNNENEALWEFEAIKSSLVLSKDLGLKIGLLFVGEKLVALSISDIASNGVAHTLFEKGDLEYDGVYQTINYLTAKNILKDCEVVNRQEDMGIEGLRRAKLSYNPISVEKKYSITR